jgi:putative ABC transport system substrate-binding protein
MSSRFHTLVGALAVLALQPGASAEQRVPVVGLLVTHAVANDPGDALRAALRVFGYEDGRNIRLEIVTARGQLDRLPGLALELVGKDVDVIVSPNEVSVRAAMQVTRTIPIVMQGFFVDPVTAGLVDSFGRPGGNVTGIYTLSPELQSKRLELVKEALPGISRVALFQDPSFPADLGELNRVAGSLGMWLELIEVRGPPEFEQAFKAVKRKKLGAVILLGSPMWYVNRARVAALALDARLPTVAMINQAVEAGALMSYGQDLSEVWARTAYYVDRLLKGAKPGDLPVEQVSKLTLAINLKTAKALGVTIPESMLLRADEVIR